jgi:hypothetical protein
MHCNWKGANTKYVLRYFHDGNKLKNANLINSPIIHLFCHNHKWSKGTAYQLCETVSVSKKLLDFGMWPGVATKLHNITLQTSTYCKCTTFEKVQHNVTEVSGGSRGTGVRRALHGSSKLFGSKMEVKINREKSHSEIHNLVGN